MLVILSVWFRDLIPPQLVPVERENNQWKHLLISQIAVANHSHSQTESDETACKKKRGRSRWAMTYRLTYLTGNLYKCRCMRLAEQVQSQCRCISPGESLGQLLKLTNSHSFCRCLMFYVKYILLLYCCKNMLLYVFPAELLYLNSVFLFLFFNNARLWHFLHSLKCQSYLDLVWLQRCSSIFAYIDAPFNYI